MVSPALNSLLDPWPDRRQMLRSCGLSLLGLSLPSYLGLRSQAAGRRPTGQGFGRARACIVLYSWGGMSHLDTWDPKPDASPEVRGEFRPIATSIPGIRIGEHMPLLARQMHRLAVVRSIHHSCTAHGKSMYWNLTGHAPPQPELAVNLPPSLNDWPNLGAMVACMKRAPRGLPAAVQLPYPLVDNSTLQAGDGPGWLGKSHAPLMLRPPRGRPYRGVSRELGAAVFEPAEGMNPPRLQGRAALAQRLERLPADSLPARSYQHFQELAWEMLLDPKVRATVDLDQEPRALCDRYGDHICGQSVLLARRLVERGVPIVTVMCSAGDLNGGKGDHWDTHSNNFERLKKDLLPPLERASAALLDDLADRGLLDQTLVVWLTEFGRTPKIMGTGRNHYPFCYSVALAGAGIRGGQVYGSSDRIGAYPSEQPCGPNDLHATIFHALGIPLDSRLEDLQGRPLPITDGRPLPLG